MSSFTSPLDVQLLDQTQEGRVQGQLLTSFGYDVGVKGSGETITVPAGFVTDFASVPRPFWLIEPPVGDAAKPAVLHDYLYCTAGLSGRYSRSQADAIFREALKVRGVSAWKRWALWSAVRLGGAPGWGRA